MPKIYVTQAHKNNAQVVTMLSHQNGQIFELRSGNNDVMMKRADAEGFSWFYATIGLATVRYLLKNRRKFIDCPAWTVIPNTFYHGQGFSAEIVVGKELEPMLRVLVSGQGAQFFRFAYDQRRNICVQASAAFNRNQW